MQTDLPSPGLAHDGALCQALPLFLSASGLLAPVWPATSFCAALCMHQRTACMVEQILQYSIAADKQCITQLHNVVTVVVSMTVNMHLRRHQLALVYYICKATCMHAEEYCKIPGVVCSVQAAQALSPKLSTSLHSQFLQQQPQPAIHRR